MRPASIWSFWSFASQTYFTEVLQPTSPVMVRFALAKMEDEASLETERVDAKLVVPDRESRSWRAVS